MPMACPIIVLVCLITQSLTLSEAINFTYNGFQSSNLVIDGIATVTSNGLLQLTNSTKQKSGNAFYPSPVAFKDGPNATFSSFSTTFVLAIRSEYPSLSGHGIAFALAPARGFPFAMQSQFLGLFNESNNGNSSNHIFAVELDTILNSEFFDINDNHVGIDINGLHSLDASPAGYYDASGSKFTNLSLISGQAMQVWVDYDGHQRRITVTMAPANHQKPDLPLLSYQADLSEYLLDSMYVGFSSSTGSVMTSHYILGWSFNTNGDAPPLSGLPRLPRVGPNRTPMFLSVGLPLIVGFLALCTAGSAIYVVRRRWKYSEVLEDWEREYGPQRFKYKDLHVATKGFSEMLGKGGFGSVYRGVLPSSKLDVAVKRVAHQSGQGMPEFVAEIASLGRLRHRNVVQLLGYCRRRNELLLVYDYMPNGSLDKYLHNQPTRTMSWNRRFSVIKGVASGLCYLHEGWEKTVIHRDVKASNVLLDGQFNGKLGDFGLARLYDHGADSQTTHVVGTIGYLAPEHTRTGRATTRTDVFAFGAFLLEVACGRRPTDAIGLNQDMILADWILFLWSRGEILEARDPNLAVNFVPEEMELVLTLGLMCLNPEPNGRPSMKQVVRYLERDSPLPPLALAMTSGGLASHYHEGFDAFVYNTASASFSSVCHRDSTNVALSCGR